jgi:hypothetical protein
MKFILLSLSFVTLKIKLYTRTDVNPTILEKSAQAPQSGIVFCNVPAGEPYNYFE